MVLCRADDRRGTLPMKRHIKSPIAGQLLSRLVEAGDSVEADTEIAVVESMKMHIPVSAEQSGRVGKWLVEEKSLVAEGQALIELEVSR